MATDRENILAKIYHSISIDTYNAAIKLVPLAIKVYNEHDKQLGEQIYEESKKLLLAIKETNQVWSEITMDLLEEIEQADFSDLLKSYLEKNMPNN